MRVMRLEGLADKRVPDFGSERFSVSILGRAVHTVLAQLAARAAASVVIPPTPTRSSSWWPDGLWSLAMRGSRSRSDPAKP